MEEITLQQLLEAGCHFGHKSERWHPRAADYIYTEKDGIHIIDLAKTKAGLTAAADFIKQTVAGGGEVLFVATKRQAKGVVKEEVEAAGAPYFVERWIGGFLTNWDGIRANIEKIKRLDKEQAEGVWKKYPKHEQLKLARYLKRLKVFYGGVLSLAEVPAALFIVDVKKEAAAVREAKRRGIAVVGIVDTNSDPEDIDWVIPANDDAVGSIKIITHYVSQAYKEAKDRFAKEAAAAATRAEAAAKASEGSVAPEAEVKAEVKAEIAAEKPKETAAKKRSQPKRGPRATGKK